MPARVGSRTSDSSAHLSLKAPLVRFDGEAFDASAAAAEDRREGTHASDAPPFDGGDTEAFPPPGVGKAAQQPSPREIMNSFLQGSLRGSIANLVAGIIGAGVLGLPYSYRLDGYWGASVCVILTAIVCDATIQMLLEACEISGQDSYADLGRTIYGARGSIAVDITIILLNFGICVTYVVLIGVSSVLPSVCSIVGVLGWGGPGGWEDAVCSSSFDRALWPTWPK